MVVEEERRGRSSSLRYHIGSCERWPLMARSLRTRSGRQGKPIASNLAMRSQVPLDNGLVDSFGFTAYVVSYGGLFLPHPLLSVS
jgi:hypothetical protein